MKAAARFLEHHMRAVVQSIVDSYPKENACAKTIAELVELRLGSSLSTDEIAYLTLHCARLSMPTPAQ
ncbi:hypothetical protein HMPREF9241_01398 [Schaalia turicensis ACS-279-V-Col4]|uniref:PRD domain-containing protein n=1 Tax=Schaalia turicensis ACS-279-V-Col4 TaxID=883077 RepID=K0YPM7_9ACTO|nr:PRD domain-containing protein [Schaalia turicensis]EJZ85398.1 hypothetical protein HMPREF9241_01398 [Schaalia turicensis ACS-279-V-Col4]